MEGKVLRLKGMGKASSPSQQGDLMLKIIIGDQAEGDVRNWPEEM